MKRAFTLSEILVTLGIIGIVAAMTLPILIKNYQQMRTINQLKKAYSVLSQALKMSEIDNDSVQNWSDIGDIGERDYINKYWKPYLKVIKVCSDPKDCGYKNNTPWKNANKTNSAVGRPNYCIIMNDGMLIYFIEYLSSGNATVFVDLNGVKQPNKFGSDLFLFVVTEKGIKPAGVNSSGASYCNKTSTRTDNGAYCSGKIVRDGWSIQSDYPW